MSQKIDLAAANCITTEARKHGKENFPADVADVAEKYKQVNNLRNLRNQRAATLLLKIPIHFLTLLIFRLVILWHRNARHIFFAGRLRTK